VGNLFITFFPSFLSILLTTPLSLLLLHPSPGKEVVRKWMERNEGGKEVRRIERKEGGGLRGRKESGSEEDDRGRRVRASEEKDGEEGEREG
jgi:hypothetical protein